MQIIDGITGVDEVGRGAIAGSVVAAAVILPKNHQLKLKDSKKLTANQRENLDLRIKEQAIDFKICSVNAEKIDQINILQASLIAMKNAIESLNSLSDQILIDGNQMPDLDFLLSCPIKIKTLVGGDQFQSSIQAAAILAKVYRDHSMNQLDQKYPQYGFKNHKGYPTKAHQLAIKQFGAIDTIHRFSFAPLKNNPDLLVRNQ